MLPISSGNLVRIAGPDPANCGTVTSAAKRKQVAEVVSRCRPSAQRPLLLSAFPAMMGRSAGFRPDVWTLLLPAFPAVMGRARPAQAGKLHRCCKRATLCGLHRRMP